MDLGLSGKVALITGASRGLGEAIAIGLAREGVDVCLAARDEARLNEVAAAIAAQSQVGTLVHAGDFRDPEVPKDAIARCVARFGRLDILVNNAGATKRGDFLQRTEEDWQDGYALKFHGYVRMTRAAWPHLRTSRGAIINTVRFSIVRKINVSTASPIRITTSNPANTFGVSNWVRFSKMKKPNPPLRDVTPKISSAPISVRHANAQPSFNPVKINGNAAGTSSLVTYPTPRSPKICPAMRSVSETP